VATTVEEKMCSGVPFIAAARCTTTSTPCRSLAHSSTEER
jgi:hypothetical protein